jgi:hypothetical protein
MTSRCQLEFRMNKFDFRFNAIFQKFECNLDVWIHLKSRELNHDEFDVT